MMFLIHEKSSFHISGTYFMLKLYVVSFVTLLQHLFQIRHLIEYLSCELSIGNNPPVPIVLQCAGANIQPLAHFLACQEMLTANSGLCVCATSLILLLTPLIADSTTCISSASIFKSLACSIFFMFICRIYFSPLSISLFWFGATSPRPHACNSTYVLLA